MPIITPMTIIALLSLLLGGMTAAFFRLRRRHRRARHALGRIRAQRDAARFELATGKQA